MILEGYPDADIGLSIVWIDMLPTDNARAARRAAQSIQDRRVRHFHDPQRRVGQALARSLAEPSRTAWDIYLFYAAGSVWTKEPPQPEAWAHQMSSGWPDHHYFGDDLERELHRIAEQMHLRRIMNRAAA